MPSVSPQTKGESAVAQLLHKRGAVFERFEDVPLETIRYLMRGAVPGMRVAHLSPELTERFLALPITRDLLCTRAGYHEAPRTHYMPRPVGIDDTIFIYNPDGRGWLEYQGKSYAIEKRDAILLPSKAPHAYGADPDNPWKPYWVHFQGKQASDYLDLIRSTTPLPVFHVAQHQELTFSIEQLLQLMSDAHTHTNLVAATGALSALLGLIQLRMRAAEKRTRTADENVEKSIEFMHRNLSRRLTLDDLASSASMSANHFGTLFSKRHNCSPINYFNQLKVQRACELLATTTLRVSEISEQLGFTDPYYFSRLFKKHMGASPSDYRQTQEIRITSTPQLPSDRTGSFQQNAETQLKRFLALPGSSE
ncbi:helix-turn-helix domain-containing protein [Pelagicoccus sp. SDUM812003]|uniref:AraC family transcriptional regulator n=1 Tax=Pelagicoccus sp. SDUM812003 TaxID=3041267 RepID=UPI0028107A52|nr:helix-turn-helix domain-containing protein [Pelagicoccus sp. SDUM812003]MDQ8201408.1 helix-turn-helix domain-containing protein [Pelagicoccus sp. SDUM812003]